MEAIANFVGAVIMLLFGLPIYHGKCLSLIAGYNTMSKAERAKYDEKKLGRCVGGMLLSGSGVLLLGALLFFLLGRRFWILMVSWGLFLVLLILGAIRLNTKNRCYKDEYR